MASILDVLCLLAALPVLVASGYLGFLTLFSGRVQPPLQRAPHLRFDLVVPARDEESGISATVRSLAQVDYPAELRRVVVVADNCSDGTARRAREAGAVVLERHDLGRTGKGFALAAAFDWSLAEGFADAVVVVDADSLVSRELLREFAARLDAGALAVQGRYGIRAPEQAWRTRLMAIAFALFHDLRSRARERLGVSAGLRGNGMCLATELLRKVPHHAFSIVEDVEYGLQLGLAGYRVHYAEEAAVFGEMLASGSASRSQRRRWEGGRLRILREHGCGLLRTALRRRDPVLLDLAMDVLVPPLSLVVIAAALGLAVSALSSLLAGAALWSLYAWGACAVLLLAYVARGWAISGAGPRGLIDLAFTPVYVAWKLAVLLQKSGHAPHAWIRTARAGERRHVPVAR
ncbi:MAG TPA: glycosyltransferase family 2 protein [Anaeromyxobacteraceae bacterium]|jgi:cellulose synthase/poly-beta-1,6-N-acetylglucosamine synthase-like glycosyltransferase|nr:glycosyltransferase family 2 protein [Anaeromyxobacteraceae bacterium]